MYSLHRQSCGNLGRSAKTIGMVPHHLGCLFHFHYIDLAGCGAGEEQDYVLLQIVANSLSGFQARQDFR